MSCSACRHAFSLREFLRVANPWCFACPHCRTELTLDPAGWWLLGGSALISTWFARYALMQLRVGSWGWDQALALVAVPLVLSLGVELVYPRVAAFRVK